MNNPNDDGNAQSKKNHHVVPDTGIAVDTSEKVEIQDNASVLETKERLKTNGDDSIMNSSEESDDEDKEWRRIRWKIDYWVQPMLFLSALFSIIDSTNIGNAQVAGLTEDIDITDDQFNWALSSFYIGFIVSEIPSSMALKKFGAQIWLPILMVTWGTILAATSAVKTGPQLIIARLFLGLASGGSQPGTIYYASLWFTRRDLSARLAIFYTGSGNIAGVIGGFLAYGIVHLDGAKGLTGWQWLFIIEALPAIVLGVLFYVLLPEGPETARFLNDRERKIVIERLAADNSGDDQEKGVSWNQFREVFRDWKTYAYILVTFCSQTLQRCIRMFLPIIIRGFGFDSVLTQAMTAPPYLASTIASILYCCSSDYFKERGFHIVAGAIVSLIAFALLIALRFSAAAGLYVCVCIGVSGVCCVVCVRAAWVSNNFGGKTKRAVAIATITAVGGIGSPLGGQFYRADDAPHYVRGHSIMVGLAGCLIIATLATRFALQRENRNRDKMSDEELKAAADASGKEVYDDKHPDYRYFL